MKDDALVEAIEEDFRSAPIDGRQRAMLEYAEKLTRDPGSMRRADCEALREAGLSDQDILHVVEVTAYYAYANRIADGLGIELEDPD